MIKEVLLLFFLASGLALSVSESQPASLLPHAAESFNISYIQLKNAGSCSYLVVISTSCSSPRYTTDQISIAFGDAYGNQIYAPRLDDPASACIKNIVQSGWYKVNVDVAHAAGEVWGVGIIVRDDKGNMLAAATWKISSFPDSSVAEAMGIRHVS
ncbi:PLAT/LH2 domain superfamily [Sesbania bispinosa]|nr:PLAT/LH2 domain superfamily [Sesbania bispinosa]